MVFRWRSMNAWSRWFAILIPAVITAIFLREYVLLMLRMLLITGIVAFLLCPVCAAMEKRISRQSAAFIAVFGGTAAVLGAVAALLPYFAGSMESLYKTLPRLGESFIGLGEWTDNVLSPIGISSETLVDGLGGKVREALSGVAAWAGNAIGTAARLVICVVLAFFVLRDREKLGLRMEMFVPMKYRNAALTVIHDAKRDIRMYVRGQAVVCLCVGVLSALALFIIGVPSALALGLMAGVLNIIPYFGPVLACVPVAISALSDGLLSAAMAIGALICVQQIDGLILSPRIMGMATGFSPGVVMLAIYFAGQIGGMGGMLLALPALILTRTCVRVLLK